MSFGERLKGLLAKKRQSQLNFARHIGISRSRLGNYINGRSEPDYATLCHIADALETSLDYLLGRESLKGGIFINFVMGREKPPAEGGMDWMPLYLSRSTAREGRPAPLGWLLDAGSLARTSEFHQPYALVMDDDSMSPEIMPGDIAIIQPRFIYHPFINQNEGRDIFGVRLNAADTVGLSLKRCGIHNNLLVCYSGNGKHAPIILDMNRILFVPLTGKMVSLWRNYHDMNMLERIRGAES